MKRGRLVLIAASIAFACLTGCAPVYKQKGYSSESDYQFSQSLGNATPQRVADLKSYGITTRQQLDAVIAEMNNINYSPNNDNWDNIFNYLKDRASAQKSKITIMQQKKIREAQEKKDNEKRAADNLKKKKDFARTYPYSATISCQFNGRSMSLPPCFQSEYGNLTDLEIRNGEQYGLYKIWELQKLGQESSDGLVLPLKKHFSIRAQNASRDLTLNIVIRDTETGQIVFQKSAGQFKWISISN